MYLAEGGSWYMTINPLGLHLNDKMCTIEALWGIIIKHWSQAVCLWHSVLVPYLIAMLFFSFFFILHLELRESCIGEISTCDYSASIQVVTFWLLIMVQAQEGYGNISGERAWEAKNVWWKQRRGKQEKQRRKWIGKRKLEITPSLVAFREKILNICSYTIYKRL